MEAWREELYHGKEWKNHKYIRKEGNRYIYEEDLKGKNGKVTTLSPGTGPLSSNIPPSASQVHAFNPGYTTQDAVLGSNANGKDGYKLPSDLQQRIYTDVLNMLVRGNDSDRSILEDLYKSLARYDSKDLARSFTIFSPAFESYGLEPDKLSETQKNTVKKMLRNALYKALYTGEEEAQHSDSNTAIYKGSLGGVAIIHRM